MTTMSVRTFLKVAQRLPANVSVLLRADHGKGKSKVARQLGRKLGFSDDDIIDRRLSQMSEGDMIGLPSTDGEVTRFNPPDWIKSACLSAKVVFLDELNRATPEVMQAAFQVVLDRELNGWKLHPDTRVIAAINTGGAYNVNEMDPALLDRFWVIDLTPDTQDWLAWARDKDPTYGGKINDVVTDFIQQDERWLDPQKNTDPGTVAVSRRSWERLNNALAFAGIVESPEDELFYPMCVGFIGTEATIAFHSFAKSIDNRFTGEQILNSYKTVRDKIVKKQRTELMLAGIDRLCDHVITLDSVTNKQGKNIAAFMGDVPAELRITLWTKLAALSSDKTNLIKSIHGHLVELIITGIFGVPLGPSGVGVHPNIPSILKAEPKKEQT